ncbi:MAG: oligosaccharide flippase family protein [Clostridium sp.]|nr:oligosaccharide flippase family protein [Clostridium sp.]
MGETMNALKNKGLTGRAVKALSVFGGTQAVGILCSVVRAKLIAIWIGPIGVGLFAIYNSVIEMVGGLTQLSMRQTAVRDVAQSSPSELGGVVSSVRWWGRWLGLLGLAVMLAASPLLSWISFGDWSHWWTFAMLAPCMLFLSSAGAEQTIMQGVGRLGVLAKALIYSALFGTALSLPLLFFFRERGVVPAVIVSSLALLIFSVKLGDVKGASQSSRRNREMGKGFLRLGASMTISTFAATAASYAFLSYLTQRAGEGVTGVYQAGYTLTVKYVGLIFTAMAMDYYPRLAAMCHHRWLTSMFVSHQASLLMCVMAPMAVVFVCADRLVLELLYSDSFMAALPMMAVAIGGVVFRALSYCYSYLIVAKGDGKVYIFTELASSAIGLALNIVGYEWKGLAGVGVSYAVWYGVYAVMCREVCRRRYGVDISRKAWMVFFAAAAIAFGAIFLRWLGWWPPLLSMPLAALLAKWAARRGRLA